MLRQEVVPAGGTVRGKVVQRQEFMHCFSKSESNCMDWAFPAVIGGHGRKRWAVNGLTMPVRPKTDVPGYASSKIVSTYRPVQSILISLRGSSLSMAAS